MSAAIVLLDPDEAVLVRVDGHEFDDGQDRIVMTWEDVKLLDDDVTVDVRVAVLPDAFMSFLVAALNALNFPEGDLEYLAERYTKEFR